MGYIYDNVKATLNMEKKDYSPNNVKALFITRSFIVAIYHVSPASYRVLDVTKSEEDIKRNGSTGAIHNLLLKRQLSCMEEIYVDPIFMQYLGAMNLEAYVSNMCKDSSRLHYYGYISADGDPVEILQKYTAAKMKDNFTYSYATDRDKSCSMAYNNTDKFRSKPNEWVYNHNLRPTYYSMDADNGLLGRYFRSVDAKLDELMEEYRVFEQYAYVEKILEKELKYMETIRDFMLLMFTYKKVKGTGEPMMRLFHSIAAGCIRENKCIEGLNVDFFHKLQRRINESFSGDIKKIYFLLDVYKYLRVMDRSSSNGVSNEVLSELVMHSGTFSGIAELLDDTAVKMYYNKEMEWSAKMWMVDHYRELPSCSKLAKAAGCESSCNGDISSYVSFILYILGYDRESFYKAMKKNYGWMGWEVYENEHYGKDYKGI